MAKRRPAVSAPVEARTILWCSNDGYEPPGGKKPRGGRCPKCRCCFFWEKFTVTDTVVVLQMPHLPKKYLAGILDATRRKHLTSTTECSRRAKITTR